MDRSVAWRAALLEGLASAAVAVAPAVALFALRCGRLAARRPGARRPVTVTA